ncbi:MAG: baseplate J/gp47 family protein [Oscillospiraceae bacterium]|nr:baseplate J/gp47 family protein [Oscillospiraceae bacterium]
MALTIPYNAPAFLQNQSTDEIHRRMMNSLPKDIDKSEAQIPWDLTRPSAVEKAHLVEFTLNETIKLMFPQFAYGEWLDYHAHGLVIERRSARKAYGNVTVRATAGTAIPAGFRFATAAELAPSVLFETTESAVFDAPVDGNGQVTKTLNIQAADAGIGGNVPADAVKLMATPTTGIVYVSNDEPITGGTPAESDDDLRERLLYAMKLGVSFTGCDADYVRWAQEVNGVGAVVVDPEWQGIGTGTVRLFLLDANGEPANQQILDDVYNHIVSPDDRLSRLCPIDSIVTVVAPEPVEVDITATVLLREGENIDTVTERFKANLAQYWKQASMDAAIKYVFVGAALADAAGVSNYLSGSLTVNGGTADIAVALGQYPVTGTITLSQ